MGGSIANSYRNIRPDIRIASAAWRVVAAGEVLRALGDGHSPARPVSDPAASCLHSGNDLEQEVGMQSKLNPYLNFRDSTREAMEFYRSVFGGKLQLSTFRDYHASQDPGEDEKIMHSVLEAESGITFMAADTPNSMEYKPGTNFNMSLSGDDEEQLRGYFEKLAAGGTVRMPLGKAPWGDTFGMLTDKFGVNWLVNISGARG
jgi:PhnB protein